MRSCPTCQRSFIDSHAVCPMDQAALGPPDGNTKLAAGLGKELGSYKLISVLGKGGMGSIYIGAHTRLNRCVAIKLVRKDQNKRTANVTRFFDEASTVTRIKHPNVVESIDLVEDVVDGAYCVMELLNGPDLKSRIAAGPLPFESAIHIAAQLADALAAVHALDIVHRDLKPENIILLERGERDDFVKLIDFGVAQTITEPGTGAPVGTAAYMAPEQGAGERVDGRADLYALGVLLFEMATGVHPFPSTTDSEYLLRHHDDEPPRPSELRPMPSALEQVILRCLAKQPADRFPTAVEVAAALRAIDLETETEVVAQPPRRRSSGKAKWVAVAMLLGGAAAAAVLVPRYLRGETATAAADPTRSALVTEPRPSDPPKPAPDPAQTEAPSTVTIEFVSKPAGATVTRAGETAPLGTTPFSAALARSDKPGQVRFERPGHAPTEVDVPLSESRKVEVAMTRITAVGTKPTKVAAPKKPGGDGTKPKQVQREGVMDPFAN